MTGSSTLERPEYINNCRRMVVKRITKTREWTLGNCGRGIGSPYYRRPGNAVLECHNKIETFKTYPFFEQTTVILL
jgi:hypothetical protein